LTPSANVFHFNIAEATPIATKTLSALPQSFFARPAELLAPELIGCLLVKRQPNGELLWGVVVETEADSQEEPVGITNTCSPPCVSCINVDCFMRINGDA